MYILTAIGVRADPNTQARSCSPHMQDSILQMGLCVEQHYHFQTPGPSTLPGQDILPCSRKEGLPHTLLAWEALLHFMKCHVRTPATSGPRATDHYCQSIQLLSI